MSTYKKTIFPYGVSVGGTGKLDIPSGTTAQRNEIYGPTGNVGIRGNTDTGELEYFIGGIWKSTGNAGGGGAAPVFVELLETDTDYELTGAAASVTIFTNDEIVRSINLASGSWEAGHVVEIIARDPKSNTTITSDVDIVSIDDIGSRTNTVTGGGSIKLVYLANDTFQHVASVTFPGTRFGQQLDLPVSGRLEKGGTYLLGIVDYNVSNAYTVTSTRGTSRISGSNVEIFIPYDEADSTTTIVIRVNGTATVHSVPLVAPFHELVPPTQIYKGTFDNVTIANYDSNVSYDVSVTTGTVNRIGDEITITISTTEVGTTTLLKVTTNGDSTSISIPLEVATISRPSILSPVNGSIEVALDLIIQSSVFASSPAGFYVQSSMIVEISNNVTFTDIIETIIVSTGDLTAALSSKLPIITPIFIRARHVAGAVLSDWSLVSSVTTQNEIDYFTQYNGLDTRPDAIKTRDDGDVVTVGARPSQNGYITVVRYDSNGDMQLAKEFHVGISNDSYIRLEHVIFNENGSEAYVIVTNRNDGINWRTRLIIFNTTTCMSTYNRLLAITSGVFNCTTLAIGKESEGNGDVLYLGGWGRLGNASQTEDGFWYCRYHINTNTFSNMVRFINRDRSSTYINNVAGLHVGPTKVLCFAMCWQNNQRIIKSSSHNHSDGTDKVDRTWGRFTGGHTSGTSGLIVNDDSSELILWGGDGNTSKTQIFRFTLDVNLLPSYSNSAEFTVPGLRIQGGVYRSDNAFVLVGQGHTDLGSATEGVLIYMDSTWALSTDTMNFLVSSPADEPISLGAVTKRADGQIIVGGTIMEAGTGSRQFIGIAGKTKEEYRNRTTNHPEGYMYVAGNKFANVTNTLVLATTKPWDETPNYPSSYSYTFSNPLATSVTDTNYTFT